MAGRNRGKEQGASVRRREDGLVNERRRGIDMTKSMRAACTALATALLCIVASGSAAATTMILEPAGEYTMASSGPVTYSGEGVEITCNVTIEGALESSIANIEREGSQLGQVTAERVSECSGGSFSAVLRLPWLTRLVRILGEVRRFIGILYLIANDTISFVLFGSLCLYVGATGMLWSFNEFRGTRVTNLGTSYTRFSGSILCPPVIIRSGTFNVSPTQTASFR
jgi:hypothetical protein